MKYLCCNSTIFYQQVKKMQSSPHFVLREAAQPPFIYKRRKYKEKGGEFCPERR